MGEGRGRDGQGTGGGRVPLETWSGLPARVPPGGSVVSVGNFDGVHRGHEALVGRVVAWARQLAATAVVVTFDPHPAAVLAPDRVPPLLTTPAERAARLAHLGVAALCTLPFDAALAALSAAEFLDRVVARGLGARGVVAGWDHRFGRDGAAGGAELASWGEAHGVGVVAEPPVLDGGEPVSSSRIRGALLAGEVGRAARWLGRPLARSGQVLPGERRGRRLGFPTANLAVDRRLVWPAPGVYVVTAALAGGQRLPAVASLGRRPTFGGTEELLEVHILDWAGDLYGQMLTVEFLDRLRAQRRFADAEQLAAQIAADVADARHRWPAVAAAASRRE